MNLKQSSIKMGLITAIASFTFASQYAQSAEVIYESFSQDTSVSAGLNGKAGGTGLSGNWSVNQTVDILIPTLDYGDLENAGGMARATNGNGTDAWVTTSNDLATNNLLDDGASLWFSYMYNKSSGGGSNEWSGFAFGTDRIDASFSGINMTNTGNGLGVATRNNGLNVSTWEGGGNASQGASASYTLGNSAFVVGRIDWGATAGDVETITIFTPSTSDLGTLGAGVSNSTSAGVDQSAFDTISFAIRNSGGSTIYDEIRFGATYEDVAPINVPEPSTTALLGLGGLALILRRRK